MPALHADVHNILLFPNVPIPSIAAYLKFSLVLFCFGFVYFYRICETLLYSNIVVSSSNELTTATDNENALIANPEANATLATLSDKAVFLMSQHKLCCYILLNSIAACIVMIGKLISRLLFDKLTTQEHTLLIKTFHQFVQFKLQFLVLTAHSNLIESFILFLPWFALQATFALVQVLIGARLRNSFSGISNQRHRQQLSIACGITLCGSLAMAFGLCKASHMLSIGYTAFLLAECALLLLHSLKDLFDLLALLNEESPRLHSSHLVYYVDLVYDISYDTLEFINYFILICSSQLAVTLSCVILFIHMRNFYVHLSAKLERHRQNYMIFKHIRGCSAEATEEDLKRSDHVCTICWAPMRCARRLPCGHTFHALCLRRWLEQDSSCAVCRKTLALDLPYLARDHAPNVQEADPTLQYAFEAFSPQNGHLSRLWNRLIFASFSEEQISVMVDNMAQMFPHTARSRIEQVLRQTGSMSLAIDSLLESGQTERPAIEPQEPQDDLNDTSSVADDSSSTSGSLTDIAIDGAGDVSSSIDVSDTPPSTFSSTNANLISAHAQMLVTQRRRYLESERAADLRANYL